MVIKLYGDDKVQNIDTIDIDDIKFYDLIQKISTHEITSESILDNGFQEHDIFFTFLYSILPVYLLTKQKIKYAKKYDDAIFLYLKKNRDLLIKYLTELKINVTKLNSIKEIKDVLTYFSTILETKKSKFVFEKESKHLKPLFLIFIRLYVKDDFREEDFKKLKKFIKFLKSPRLRTYIKSIELDSIKIDLDYDSNKKDLSTFTRKLFGNSEPTIVEIEKVSKSDNESYKLWRTKANDLKKTEKELVVEKWLEDYDIGDLIDIKDARILLKELKLSHLLVDNYVGKVGLGRTPASIFIYYTTTGLQLSGIPGRDVEMNPKYNPDKDDSYYCSGFPTFTSSGEKIRYRTISNMHKSAGEIFANNANIVDKIDEVRINIAKVAGSEKLTSDKLSALLFRLCDETCGRIGSQEEERGLRILKVSNIKDIKTTVVTKLGTKVLYGKKEVTIEKLKKGATVLVLDKDGNKEIVDFKDLKVITPQKNCEILQYLGKDDCVQTHIVRDPMVVEYIKWVKANREKGDFIFSLLGNKPISLDYITKFIKSQGFPASFHKLRNYHASRLFSEFINSLEGKKLSNEKLLEQFNNKVKEIASLLGHDPVMSIKNYIDGALIKYFFDKHKDLKQPSAVIYAINKLKGRKDNGEKD